MWARAFPHILCIALGVLFSIILHNLSIVVVPIATVATPVYVCVPLSGSHVTQRVLSSVSL